MKKKRKLLGISLLILALLVLQFPGTEAAAASSAASDFTIEDGILTKYNGTARNVTIPNTVWTIATDAFKNNTNIVTVSIPNSVTRIEPYAFWGCSGLEAVAIGAGLDEIGDFVFANCKGLDTVVLPSNILSIGIDAFQDDIRLTDITIPFQTRFIHETAFNGCYNLVIHAPEGSYAYRYAQAFAERQEEMPEYEDVETYVPDTVVIELPENGNAEDPADGAARIGIVSEDAEGNPIATVRIVGNRAVFFLDGEVPTVYAGIPADTDEEAPGGESAQEPLPGAGGESAEPAAGEPYVSTIPKYTIVNSADGSVVADQAFYRAGAKTSLELPGGVVEIGQFSYARSGLTSAYFPGNVRTIGYGAFYHCDDLAYAELPATVEVVEPMAFERTKWVEEFQRGSSNPERSSETDFLVSGGVLVAYRGTASEVSIPENVRIIAAGALSGHAEITSVTFPDAIVSIGEEAFAGCTSLRELSLPETASALRSIKDRAFADCALDSVTLPASLEELGLDVFDERTEVLYLGNAPRRTHERTAERLSNASLRERSARQNALSEAEESSGAEESRLELLSGEAGVRVVYPAAGAESGGILAALDGADRMYTLTAAALEKSEPLQNAVTRAEGIVGSLGLRGAAAIYDLVLSDESGIPITKLGRQALTLAVPVPEEFSGQVLRVLTIDRNGQLEELPCERVRAGSAEYVRFQTYHLSPFGVYATGEELADGELIVSETVLAQNAPAPEGEALAGRELIKAWAKGRGIRLYIAAALVLSGMVLILWRRKDRS